MARLHDSNGKLLGGLNTSKAKTSARKSISIWSFYLDTRSSRSLCAGCSTASSNSPDV